MPIYEYRCASCHQKTSFFVRSVYAKVEAVCPQCGSEDMTRLISSVAFKTSSASTPETDYYKDPSNIGKNTEESFKKFGVPMPESVRKTIEHARQGNMPEGLDL